MHFFFSGELDHEVSETYRPVRQRIERVLNEALSSENYGNALEKIAIIPMILSPCFAEGRKERRLLQHKEKAADYRLFIDFLSFANGSVQDRERLLLENVINCIEDIGRKLKGKFDSKRLLCDIRELFPEIDQC
jgi:hypothetical protein